MAAPRPAQARRILVIRLSALGDFVLSFPAFSDIRAHHAAARITLLTTRPFAALAADSPWFDAISIDARPKAWNLPGLLRLRRRLRGFDRIYDLQTSSRSARYFTLAGRPPWSGIAPGCAFPHRNPNRNDLHTVPRQREQLADAGVPSAGPPDLDWLRVPGPTLPQPYALLVPGTSLAHGGAKRWPTDRFALLAGILRHRGLTPVVVGTAGDAPLAAMIRAHEAGAIDLTGRTTLRELAALAARAALAVGGDTGPIHLAGMMGCPVIALFSRFSDPALAAPVGRVTLVRQDALEDLSVERVIAALDQRP